jgi:hypothetical protein
MLPDYLKFAQNYWYPEITGATIMLPRTIRADACYPLASALPEVDKPNIPVLAIALQTIANIRGDGADNSNITITSFQEKISALFRDFQYNK